MPLAIASDLEPTWGDYNEFVEEGWDAGPVQRGVPRRIDAYLAFLAGSRGELGIAKEGYMVSRGGWISDRSVTYLALGRPVLLQDTGWTAAVAPSEGMLVFHETRDCAEADPAPLRRIMKHTPGRQGPSPAQYFRRAVCWSLCWKKFCSPGCEIV